MQETRNIINSNAQNTNEFWSNVFLTEINVLLFVNIKRCDFPLYSHCQGQTFPRSVDSNNSIDWSLSVGLSQCVCCCSPSVQQSDMDKFHCQLVAQCLYLVCNTVLLHVSAIHFGLLQGATNLIEVYRVYGKLSQMCSFHIHIYIIIIQLSITIYMHSVFIHDTYCQYLNVGFSDPD